MIGLILTGLQNGADYHIKVKAINAIGESAFSSTIEKKPLNLLSILLNLQVNLDENTSVPEYPNYQCVKINRDIPEKWWK